jgi:hypothetical protein
VGAVYLSVILPNLLLFLVLTTVVPWVIAIVDILRADDTVFALQPHSVDQPPPVPTVPVPGPSA